MKYLFLILFVSCSIFPQQTFRNVVYLSQSFGTHIYDHSLAGSPGTTTVPNEVATYNSTHGYTGNNAFTINRITPDYPLVGDMIWQWNQVFFGGSLYSNTQNVITDCALPSTYDIINVTIGFNSGDIWFAGWYNNITDTLNYPLSHIENVYKYWIRQMVATMELYPDKYWILWTIPPVTVGSSGGVSDALRHANFNNWMVNILQAGLDSYGTFPSNVYIFDVFSLLKSPNNNFMNPAYADGIEDSHPNALASSVVAPILVQRMFNSAIAYEESLLPVELSQFSASVIGSTVNLNWTTETEVNNFGFNIERKSDVWETIGFVHGNGNSNSPKTYSFTDSTCRLTEYSYRLKQIDNDGQFEYSKIINVDLENTSKFKLNQNYPNPFNSFTTISYEMQFDGYVNLKIYDILGNEMFTVVDNYQQAGYYQTNIDASLLSSGIYFYVINCGNFTENGKMVIIK